MLLACAGKRPETSPVSSEIPASEESTGYQTEQATRWSSPEQESWVEEPVFNGSIHLVEVSLRYAHDYPEQVSFPMLDNLIKNLAQKTDDWTRALLVLMDRMPDIPQIMMSNDPARTYLYKDRTGGFYAHADSITGICPAPQTSAEAFDPHRK